MNWFRAMSKQKQQQVILTALVAMIAIAGAWIFFAGKQFSALQKSRARLVELEKRLTEATRAADQMAKNMPTREKMQSFVDSQQASMVNGDSFAWVVREITLLAEQHPVREVSLRSGKIMPHARKSRYEWYVTKVEFSGSYDQIGAFVRDLENKYSTAEVRGLEISGSDAAPDKLRAVVEIALLVHPSSGTDQKKGA